MELYPLGRGKKWMCEKPPHCGGGRQIDTRAEEDHDETPGQSVPPRRSLQHT